MTRSSQEELIRRLLHVGMGLTGHSPCRQWVLSAQSPVWDRAWENELCPLTLSPNLPFCVGQSQGTQLRYSLWDSISARYLCLALPGEGRRNGRGCGRPLQSPLFRLCLPCCTPTALAIPYPLLHRAASRLRLPAPWAWDSLISAFILQAPHLDPELCSSSSLLPVLPDFHSNSS